MRSRFVGRQSSRKRAASVSGAAVVWPGRVMLYCQPSPLVALMAYVGCFAFSLGPILWLIISEIYPLRVRGRAVSIATLSNWVANFVVSFVFLTMIKAFGSTLTFAIYGAICLVTIWFIRTYIRETKSLELDSISSRT